MKTATGTVNASTVLTTVRESYINKTNESTLICINVTDELGRLTSNRDYTNYIVTQIEQDLAVSDGCCKTYKNWLSRKLGYFPTNEQLHEAKIQYLAALIEYYQNLGD